MTEGGTHWVFGYGSLMWNPGFPYLRAVPARISGYHRKLCVYSFHYRGSPEKPGLVFGLDRGGSCLGMAFEVAAADWAQTWDYLRKREQVTMVYRELFKQVRLQNGAEVMALTYAVDRRHAQCAAGLSDPEIAALVRQGEGHFRAATPNMSVQHPWTSARTSALHDPAIWRASWPCLPLERRPSNHCVPLATRQNVAFRPATPFAELTWQEPPSLGSGHFLSRPFPRGVPHESPGRGEARR
jgi:cation transport protein ChaC